MTGGGGDGRDGVGAGGTEEVTEEVGQRRWHKGDGTRGGTCRMGGGSGMGSG